MRGSPFFCFLATVYSVLCCRQSTGAGKAQCTRVCVSVTSIFFNGNDATTPFLCRDDTDDAGSCPLLYICVESGLIIIYLYVTLEYIPHIVVPGRRALPTARERERRQHSRRHLLMLLC